jgi:hypothetical protein
MINETIKKNGITFGVLTGLFSILVTTAIYVIDLNLFTAWWLGLINIAIYIIIAIVLLSKTKKELNGVFTFKEAFTTYFISGLIGLLLSVGFSMLLFNVVDLGAQDTIKELTIKYMVTTMEKFNAPAETVNAAIKDLQENNQFSVLGLLKGLLTNIIFVSIFGLIMAAFFKSRPSTQE